MLNPIKNYVPFFTPTKIADSCDGREGGSSTDDLQADAVGKHVVVFALNANFLSRAPVLQALCIVSQAWFKMKIWFKP